MGIIKVHGKTIYEGPISKVDYVDNWCDSMAEYYPYLVITYIDIATNDIKSFRAHDFVNMGWPMSNAGLEIVVDDELADYYKSFVAKRDARNKYMKVDMHKPVRVVKGRKVKIGTEGEIMWIGPNRFGPGENVGIRLIDGSVVFTAMSNVRVIDPDEEIEKILLGN